MCVTPIPGPCPCGNASCRVEQLLFTFRDGRGVILFTLCGYGVLTLDRPEAGSIFQLDLMEVRK